MCVSAVFSARVRVVVSESERTPMTKQRRVSRADTAAHQPVTPAVATTAAAAAPRSRGSTPVNGVCDDSNAHLPVDIALVKRAARVVAEDSFKYMTDHTMCPLPGCDSKGQRL